MAFAKMQIIGNIGRDPELRYTPNGRPVTSFSVAVSHSKPDGHGGWIDEGTDWFNISVWGERGERVAETMKKGTKVFVDGRFKTRTYDRNAGGQGTSMDISADTVIDVGKPRGEQSESQSAPTHDRAADDDVDELPF